MVAAFKEGAEAAGHEVEVLHVGKMKIGGCLGCEYCHTRGEGKCVQKDDMEKVIPAYQGSDMVVFASPIYYFDMTAQLSAAIQRVYCIGKPTATRTVPGRSSRRSGNSRRSCDRAGGSARRWTGTARIRPCGTDVRKYQKRYNIVERQPALPAGRFAVGGDLPLLDDSTCPVL